MGQHEMDYREKISLEPSRALNRMAHCLPRVVLLMVLSGLVLGCTSPPTVSQEPLVDTEEARPYTGEMSLEERIALADVVARVSLQAISSGVTTAYLDEEAPERASYIGHLDFNFRVLEYLKGSGGDELTAVVLVPGNPAGPVIDTREKMENALPDLVAIRDTQWDDREAVVFLKDNYGDGSHAYLPYIRQAGRYYIGSLSVNGLGDDDYTVSSTWNKAWLPEGSPSGVTAANVDADQKEFLADAPAGPTITVSALKAKITEVSSWLAENGGSEDQKKCVRDTYRLERYTEAVEGSDPDDHPRIQTSRIESGLAAGTEVWSDYGGTVHKDLRARFWLEGGDSDLFEVQLGSAAPYDVDGGGTNDTSRFERRLHIVRPLPSGTYSFQVHEQGALYTLCDGWVYRYPVTVTVNAPADVTAESFFDPAASGTAATGATNLGSISWENGRVEATLNWDITDRALGFIVLDGSAVLLLKGSDAARTGDTWMWTVSPQPWDDGDKLMVRLYLLTDTTCAGETVPFAALPVHGEFRVVDSLFGDLNVEPRPAVDCEVD